MDKVELKIMDSLSPSSELALANDYLPTSFVNVKQIIQMIERRRDEIDEEGLQKINYLSFKDVTPSDFDKIDKYRELNRLHFRITYFPDITTLVIKINTREHEKAHAGLFQLIIRKISTGLDMDEFLSQGMATIESPYRLPGQPPCRKEAGSSAINIRLRPYDDDWPQLVIEAGVSECLPWLEADAKWWIEHSAGQVRIVILIQINKLSRNFRFIKCVPRPCNDSPCIRSHMAADIDIDLSVSPSQVRGAALTIRFEEAFARQPVSSNETDIIFTVEELDEIAGLICD